jgi:DNA polymerase I-like protein with 3'-5' exonuclease and polymerase domains
MYEYIILDVETTIFQKGNPYSRSNKLCLVGLTTSTKETILFDIEYTDHSYSDLLQNLQEFIDKTNLLILVNAKFDLAWLRRYNINYSHCKVFDCQLFAYTISGQTHAYPSLNGMAEFYGLGTKLDIVKDEYWAKGIDTPQIPYSILAEYLEIDLQLTHEVYLEQQRVLSSQSNEFKRLISLVNQDLLVLLEMEYNGLLFDFDGMSLAAQEIELQINQIREELNNEFSEYPVSTLNYGSGDVISTLLYGGTLTEIHRHQVGVYKSGTKQGSPRFQIEETCYPVPRLVQPPKGSELKKEGFFATNEATLRSIKTDRRSRRIIDNLLNLSKLEKLNGTYYLGLQKLHAEKDWDLGIIHGQFNQCVARTGRLSSSTPNLQNFPIEIDNFTLSRYD